jgi:hypothetical protein
MASWLQRTAGNIATALDELDNQVEGLLDQTPERSKIEARSSRRPKYVSRKERPRYPTPRKLETEDTQHDKSSTTATSSNNKTTPLVPTATTSATTTATATSADGGGGFEVDAAPGDAADGGTDVTEADSTTTMLASHNKILSGTAATTTTAPPSAPPSALAFSSIPDAADDDILSMLQDENNRLKDRIRAQDAELEAMDTQLLDTQEELETLELAHSSYCDDADAREKTLRGNVQQLEVLASSSTDNVRSMVQQKDAAITALKVAMSDLESSHEASLSFLRQQLEDATLENEELEEKCHEYRGQSRDVGEGRAQILLQLRQDLSTMEQQRRVEHDKHARALKESQQRERTIQSVNNELTRALSNTERRAETLAEQISTLERDAVLNGVNGVNPLNGLTGKNDGQEWKQQMSSAQQELEVERDRVQRSERELRAIQHELALAKTMAATIQRRTELNMQEKEEEITRLQSKVNSFNGTTNDAGRQELRDQLNVLTERVLTQQSTIEKLTSQRVMLQQINVDMKEKNVMLNIAAREQSDLDEDIDLEGGATYGLSQRRSGGGGSVGSSGSGMMGSVHSTLDGRGEFQHGSQRRVSSLTSIRQLRPLLSKNKTLANAVRSLDRFAFVAMNVIRRFPTARLFFLLYMMTLHAWSIFLVSHHSSCITSDLHSGAGGGSHNHQIPGAMPAIPGPPRLS